MVSPVTWASPLTEVSGVGLAAIPEKANTGGTALGRPKDMKHKIGSAAAVEPSWDLTLQIDGRDYAVRQPSLKQFNDIQARARQGQNERKLLLELIDGEPDLASLDDDAIDEMSTVISTYFWAWLEKKRNAIRAAVMTAMTAQTLKSAAASTSGPQ